MFRSYAPNEVFFSRKGDIYSLAICIINLPQEGLISIFLPAVASSDLQSIEFSDYNQVKPAVYHFVKLEDLVATENPVDLRVERVTQNIKFKSIKTIKTLNPDFEANQTILTPPILKPDSDGSFTSYFKALEHYSKAVTPVGISSELRTNSKFLSTSILEKTSDPAYQYLDLEFEEIFLNFTVFASFPYWAESDVFAQNGFPVDQISELSLWLERWHDQNKYSGSNILGYSQAVQNIDQSDITALVVQNYGLAPDAGQKLWHLLSFGWDFEEVFSRGPLAASNNFYLYQSAKATLNIKHSWLDVQSD